MSLITKSLGRAVLAAALAAGPFAAVLPQAAIAQGLPIGPLETGPRSVADLAENLLPSVVNISTSQRLSTERPSIAPDGDEESPFREYFDEFFERDEGAPDPRRAQSLGSGFVISEDGVVVTNNHVIRDADEVWVNFADGRELAAEIVGRDEATDIAVLRIISDTPLKPLDFGASQDLRIGDWVMAIGNPFGLGGTVTVGIISARNRNLQSGPYDDYIQTDAAINRGNSGGPLFDMQGNVIGINTAILSPTGGSVGIGFAIPSEIATRVINQLLEFGETRRGWLGVRIDNVSDDMAESLGLDRPRGALVAGVTENGPAEAGGIAAGDVVVRFDGREITEMRQLPRIVAETDIGKRVEVVVLRNGEEIRLAVDLGRLGEEEEVVSVDEDAETEAPAADGDQDEGGMTVLGMTLAALDDDRRSSFGIADDVAGVLVTEVLENSGAEEKRIRPGDVILEVDQAAVIEPQEVAERVEALRADGRRTALLTLSNTEGQLRFTTLRLEE